jgi:hypothetical protein
MSGMKSPFSAVSLLASFTILSVVLVRRIDAIENTDIPFVIFENEFFPSEYSITVGGLNQLFYRIGSRHNTDKSTLQVECLSNGFESAQCIGLWNAVRDAMFNPEGVKMGGAPDLSYELTREATRSERANFMSSCTDERECLLSISNEYTLARSIFSSYSSAEVVAMRRVAFLHSVYLEGGTTAILESMLTDIAASGLLLELDCVFVINYGMALPQLLVSAYPSIVFVHGSSDTARFEIPTLQVVHYFSRLSLALRGGSMEDTGSYQVLYLHTKGVSANSEIEPVRDWRKYMSYFVVNQFRKCIALLSTGLYDVMGVDLIATYSYPWQEPGETNLHFSGNFWWASVDYIAGLPTLSVNRNLKYDGEFWVSSGRTARLLSLHNSGVNHYARSYPLSEYAHFAHEL